MAAETQDFFFHGDVVAFGALLDRPRRREVRGTVALARVGGRASMQEDAWDLDGVVRYRYASSGASGDKYNSGDTKIRETRATCTLEGFEFGSVVRADFVSATLVSTFTLPDQQRFHEETVTLKGLWADGKYIPVESRVPEILGRDDCRKFQKLKDTAGGEGLLAAKLADLHTRSDGSASPGPRKLVKTSNGHLACYLLEPNYITFDRKGIKYELFLGEYLIYDQQRRLTMLRIEAHPQAGPASGRGEASQSQGKSALAATAGDPPPEDSKDPEGSAAVAQLAINGHKHP